MNRRDMLLTAGAAALGLSTFPAKWLAAADAKKRTLLYFTRSAGFVHPMVDRHGKRLSKSEEIMIELGRKHGFEVVCSQDAKDLDGDLTPYDAIAFYTSGDALSEKGKKNLLDAIHAGKGFVGIHSATDTFRLPGEAVDPYIAMIGGEFTTHESQQKTLMKVCSPKFPGVKGLGDGFTMLEEWYAFHKFSPDLHVILLQETAGMHDAVYQRPPYPATWARKHGDGRVFYTSMGHRDDVWTSPEFTQVLLGGLAWAFGDVEADVKPNIAEVAPGANSLKN